MTGYIAFFFTALCAGCGVLYAIHSSRFMAFMKQFGDAGFYHMTKGAVYVYFDHEDFPAEHTEEIRWHDLRHKILFRATIAMGIVAVAFQMMSR